MSTYFAYQALQADPQLAIFLVVMLFVIAAMIICGIVGRLLNWFKFK